MNYKNMHDINNIKIPIYVFTCAEPWVPSNLD
jgi:hypothetical protein